MPRGECEVGMQVPMGYSARSREDANESRMNLQFRFDANLSEEKLNFVVWVTPSFQSELEPDDTRLVC